ncbi:MAG: VWA domain-containing protein [Candidatus Korobacteraceae bacterium]
MAVRSRLALWQRWLAPAIFLLLASAALPSQQASPSQETSSGQQSQASTPTQSSTPAATFSSNVKVVNVLATVRDKHGQIVNNLTKDDFKLEQDGHPQNIHYFAKETDLPLTLGLLVDTSMSQRRVLEQERSASYGFLNDLMRPEKDKAFVIHFDWDIELLQDLTSSHQKLEAALEKLDMPQFDPAGSGSPGGGGGGGGGGHHRMGGGTTLYDAVFLASDELMRKQEGRKALVLLTDGVDTGSKVSLARAIETAQRANTMVYSILYSDPDAYGHNFGHMGGMGGGMGRHGGMGYPGGGGGYPQQVEPADGKKVLQRISKETGGRFFEVSKKQPINEIYTQIEDELRNQYSLGYTPDKAVAETGYHKITLTTNNKDLIVQTREGYYAEQ